MDRQIVYPGQIPLETDLLNTNKNVLVALGILAQNLFGTSTQVSGLACSPSSPAALTVQVAPGSIYSLQNLDGSAYGSLAADTTHQIVKQGILLDPVTLSCPAPATAGFSINYLIQAAYQDTDASLVTLPYYNATNPTQAYSGPNNSGTSQATKRQGQVVVSAKAGIAAATGTQVTPAADSGYVGLWVVTVANGQATIVSGNIAAVANAPFISNLTAFITNLGTANNASAGTALVGGLGQLLNYAVGTLGWQLKNQAINVLWNGVKGDNTTDDTAQINVLGALGLPLYFPYTTSGYKITGSVTFGCNVVCEGAFMPTTAVGANPAIILASGGYIAKRWFKGLRVVGSPALMTAGVNGIRNDCENSTMVDCYVNQLNYGFIIRMFSITLDKCRASGCNQALSAYARSSSQQINTLTIRGGNYDSSINRSVYIGDTTWPDAWAAGNLHANVVHIGGGANFDGGEIKIDNAAAVTIDTVYTETSSTNYGIVLGGAADGSVRNVTIRNYFAKTLHIAIKCLTAVNGLRVERNFYTAVSHCALYLVSDLYPFYYEQGDSTASYTYGQEVHTGCRWLSKSVLNFAHVTLPHLGVNRGAQLSSLATGIWYPGGQVRSLAGQTQTDSSGDNLRRYSAPATGIAGTVNTTNNTFTFTTATDAAKFNGMDSATLSTGGASYIRYIDYEAGVAYLDGTTTNGAATLSQVQASYRTEGPGTAAPTSGTYARGDRVFNITPAVGSPKGWSCTVAGTPGTWVSEGNL